MLIRFYKHRFVYFAISIAIILTGVIFAFAFGIKLDIQFKGGTILKYAYTGTVDAEKAGTLVEDAIGVTTSCQLQSNIADDSTTLIVNIAGSEEMTSTEQQTITSVLTEAFPDNGLTLSTSLTVEPFMGARFFRNGLIAIALSFILILIYVGIRFRNIGGTSAGVMAIVALFHDAFVVTSVFIVFQIPLGDTYIAAILTILGFSINDTIVIYDRIRENRKVMNKKTTPEELVDTSISQSMMRSINTNIAVFVSITIVYIFSQVYNIDSIRAFALPMMFGTVSGCYSTICIAGPLWTMWQNHKLNKKAAA